MKFLIVCLVWLVLLAVFWPLVLVALILLPVVFVLAIPFALLAVMIAAAYALV